MTRTTVADVRASIEATNPRSAWKRGVKACALDLLADYADDYPAPTRAADLLNGADDWHQYSYGGCALIYDCDIAERLCSPSELKRCRGGDRRPNAREEWLDVQARALAQAARILARTARSTAPDPALPLSR